MTISNEVLSDGDRNLMKPMRRRPDGNEGHIWDAACLLDQLVSLETRGLIKFSNRENMSPVWVLTDKGREVLNDDDR